MFFRRGVATAASSAVCACLLVVTVPASGATCVPTRPANAKLTHITGTIYRYLCGMQECFAQAQEPDGTLFDMVLADTRTIDGVVITCNSPPWPGGPGAG